MDANGYYTQEEVEQMPDVEVLAKAGNLGPAMIGKPLYERAAFIQRTNPGGTLGKAFFEDAKPPIAKSSVAPSPAAADEPDEPEGEALSAEEKEKQLAARIAEKKGRKGKQKEDRRAPEGTEAELERLFKALEDGTLPEEDRRVAQARVDELTAPPPLEVADELKDQPTE